MKRYLFILLLTSCYPDQSCPEYEQYAALKDELFELDKEIGRRGVVNNKIMPLSYYDSLCARRVVLVGEINSVDCPAVKASEQNKECGFNKH